MKTRMLVVVVLLAASILANIAHAQVGRIKSTAIGMNVEKDQFYVALNSNPTRIMGYFADLGIGQIRTGIPPFYNQGSQQAWWDQCWDNATGYCADYGIKLTFLFGSAWWSTGTADQAYLSAFRAKVSQYKGLVHYYELGNEMDICFQDKGITVAQYKQWLTDMAAVIRQEDPNAKIILTSMAGRTDSANGKPYGYLQEILQAGCGSLVDYYSIHTYPWNPNSDPSGDALKTLLTSVAGMVQAAGAPVKPLFITETGYPLSGPYAPALADSGYQERWNTQKLIRFLAKDIMDIYPVERIDSFCLKDFAAEPYGFGLLDTTETPRWQYAAFKQISSLLNGALFLNERTLASDSKCYEFMKANGQKVVVAWSNNWQNHSYNIPVGSTFSNTLNIHGAVVTSYSNPVTVPITYTEEQQYIVTGTGTNWKEGESYSSANFTPSASSNDACYNGKYLSVYTATYQDRYIYYNFTLPRTGSYSVYIAATPPNINWASPYEYTINSGTAYDGSTLRSSKTSAVRTGPYYGVTNSLCWTKLGDFALSSGPGVFTLRLRTPRQLDGKYVFYLDSIYIEPSN